MIEKDGLHPGGWFLKHNLQYHLTQKRMIEGSRRHLNRDSCWLKIMIPGI